MTIQLICLYCANHSRSSAEFFLNMTLRRLFSWKETIEFAQEAAKKGGES